MISYIKDSKGIAILIALVILGTLVATAAGVASVFVKEIRISSFVDDSVLAVIAADAGVERKLYEIRKLEVFSITPFTRVLSNGARYGICEVDGSCVEGDPSIIKITGELGNVKRSFEVSL